MPTHNPSGWSRREALQAGLVAWVGSSAAAVAAGAEAGNATGLITKAIPSTGERLPAIGLGTDSFRSSERAAIQAEIQRMRQLGGTVIDTSSDYGDSEQVIGAALQALNIRDRLFIATKLTGGGGFFDGVGGEASLRRSLERLKTQRVDLLQVHNLDGTDSLMPMMQAWKKAGQVRYLGVTTSDASQHDEIIQLMRKYPLDFIQVDYSIADRDAAKTVLATALERKIAVLANLPLARASLIGQAGERKLPIWMAEIGVSSWSQFFLKYVISHPAVTCAIPGTTKVAHMEDNQAAGRGVLPDAAMRRKMEQYWDSVT